MNPTEVTTEPGTHTLSEIFSQPEVWSKCLSKLAATPGLERAVGMARQGAEWVLIGCGTSYYLAVSAAATYNAIGLPARAVPASEVLLYPSLALPIGRDFIPVVISRSGRTSEAIRAAKYLEEERDVRTIAITCADGEALERACSVTLKLRDADEQSTVMTRSFTSMLLGLQYLAARICEDTEFQTALLELPTQVSLLLDGIPGKLRAFVEERSFEDCVFLAQGPLFGIASECMLKVTEASCTYAQVFHSLEFRHGPRAIAGPETLITFLLSESSYDAEIGLVEEMKEIGASTMVIANRLDERARTSADFSIELGLSVPEYARVTAYALWGQLHGVYRGIKKGLNPDAPKNLSRVVVLEGSS